MMTPIPDSSNGCALVVDGASKRFDKVQALAGASLTVGRGEMLGLLGPNGAGKTTLIKAIAGRLALDSGSIRLFGRVLTSRDERPDLGVVPQEIALYRLLTARENLRAFGALYGVPRDQLARRAAWALDWAGLSDRADEPVRGFSGGMLRRLNIACGLMHEPRLVLLDEPTVGVDPQSRERIYEMLAVIERSGVSLILTTHHLEEAERRCRRIVIIDHGRIVAEGAVGDIVARATGASRLLTIALGSPLTAHVALPDGLVRGDDGRHVTSLVSDIAVDVPERLRQIAEAGGLVTDVRVTGASLQDAFIALTGRELRE